MDRKQQKRFEIIDYAIEHGWVINPGKSMEVFVDHIIKFGYCPCDSTRPNCPCPQAEAEVTERGHCRCSLYWKDHQAYRATLRPVKGEEKDEGISKEETD